MHDIKHFLKGQTNSFDLVQWNHMSMFIQERRSVGQSPGFQMKITYLTL